MAIKVSAPIAPGATHVVASPPSVAIGTAPTLRKHSLPPHDVLQRLSATNRIRPVVPPATRLLRQVTFVVDLGPHVQIDNVRLNGSWDKRTGRYSKNWGEQTIALKNVGGGKWLAQVDLLDDGQQHAWEWGVVADAPGKKDHWMVMGEQNLRFTLHERTKVLRYRPTTYHFMGAQRTGTKNLSFRVWLPGADQVNVRVDKEDGSNERFNMLKNDDGTFCTTVVDGWARLKDLPYTYEITADDTTFERTDPYGRVMQGEQRGVGRLYIDPTSGKEVDGYFKGAQPLARFEVQGFTDAERVALHFVDQDGTKLNGTQLRERLGSFDSSLVNVLRGGKFNDHVLKHLKDNGDIELVRPEGGDWTTLIHNLNKLNGLRYEFNVWKRNEHNKLILVGDKNRNKILSDAERRHSPFNDPWNNIITDGSGMDFRSSIVADIRYDFQHDNAPRERDPKKWVVYQAHVGSFFSGAQNTKRSTFADLEKHLQYLKTLGVTTLELLPTNEFEGNRDWGYMGVNNLANESAYGFFENGTFVNGTRALQRFVDAAHAAGINVIGDVVYNHVFSPYNLLWEIDGKKNSFFNWSQEPDKVEIRHTQFGPLPAFNNPNVRQFFIDHAVVQIEDLHFDGLRFDFTGPIKETGGKDGWDFLREANRQLHFYKPNTFTIAEQFPYDPSMTEQPQPDGTGAGFDAQWYSEYQHRVISDFSRPGLLQAAGKNQALDVDRVMDMLLKPEGIGAWSKVFNMLSNHDEVRTDGRNVVIAAGGQQPSQEGDWAIAASRMVAGLGLFSPGIPFFFQGDEFMSASPFQWSITSTWDLNWDWQTSQHPLAIRRRQMFSFYKDAIALRQKSPELQAHVGVEPVYTHNQDGVLAFSRAKEDAQSLVIASFNKKDLVDYPITLPAGRWQLVLSSDDKKYGGNGMFANRTTILEGAATVTLAAGSVLLFKRID